MENMASSLSGSAATVNVLIVSPVAFIPDSQGSRKRVHQMVNMMEAFGFNVRFLFVRRDDQNDADALAMSACLNGGFTELADAKKPGMSRPWFFQVRVASKLGLYRYCNIHPDAWYFDEIGRVIRDTVKAEQIHIVLVEYPFYSKALESIEGVLKVIDMHDVFADRYKEFLRNGKRPFPWYSVTMEGEIKAIGRADIVLAIQGGDAEVFRGYGHPAVLALSYAPRPVPQVSVNPSSPLRLCFLGTGNFFNIRALEHFLQHIHPVLLAAAIDYEFVVIGAVCASFLQSQVEGNVRFLGRVDDLEAELAQCDALVNPLSSGTGLPIKVLDALASGLHVLATDAGARGVPARHALSAISICDEEREWIDAVRKLAEHKRNGLDLRAIALSDLARIQHEIDAAKHEFHAAIIAGLRSLGHDVPVHNLEARTEGCVEAA